MPRPPESTRLAVPLPGRWRREHVCPPAGAVPTTTCPESQRKPTAARWLLPCLSLTQRPCRPSRGDSQPTALYLLPSGDSASRTRGQPRPRRMSLRSIKISHKNTRGRESCKGPPWACVSKHGSGASGRRNGPGTAVCQVGEMLGTVLQAYFQTWHRGQPETGVCGRQGRSRFKLHPGLLLPAVWSAPRPPGSLGSAG